MLIDHIGYIFFPHILALRAIGRLAFPIFCFLIVEGFYHTRSHVNYLSRLCVFALISEIPFDLAFFHTIIYLPYQNVFITLALGLASLFCLEEMNTHKLYVIPLVLIWGAAYLVHCDYGIGGVILIDMFYLAREMPFIRLVLCTLTLYSFGRFELYGVLSMIPITLYNGRRGPNAKMFFYWFYPLHLLALYAIGRYL
ncbi:MAG: hypothetical protein IJ801_06170 [Lachnospiraceae bacterium]|nr:hypothetical protein [Lachnospiraceae bacterium]